MYNHQLETFLRVADAGSFNRAAEESYLSTTAVIKQINLLEGSLGVKLFERTHQGLTLTEAGHSMYRDAEYIIRYCNDAVARARSTMQKDCETIRIGTSPIWPVQRLMELLPQVRSICPELRFRIVPYENTPQNAKKILANLGTDIDVLGGFFDETTLDLRGCAGLELTREPFCCAVSVHHRLAAKDRLQIRDLYGENLLMIHKGWSGQMDQLREELLRDHPQVRIVDFGFYNMEVFNRCENSGDVLLVLSDKVNIHPLLKMIPVEWDYGISYGILHSPDPAPAVRRFLEAVKMAGGNERV